MLLQLRGVHDASKSLLSSNGRFSSRSFKITKSRLILERMIWPEKMENPTNNRPRGGTGVEHEIRRKTSVSVGEIVAESKYNDNRMSYAEMGE